MHLIAAAHSDGETLISNASPLIWSYSLFDSMSYPTKATDLIDSARWLRLRLVAEPR